MLITSVDTTSAWAFSEHHHHPMPVPPLHDVTESAASESLRQELASRMGILPSRHWWQAAGQAWRTTPQHPSSTSAAAASSADAAAATTTATHSQATTTTTFLEAVWEQILHHDLREVVRSGDDHHHDDDDDENHHHHHLTAENPAVVVAGTGVSSPTTPAWILLRQAVQSSLASTPGLSPSSSSSSSSAAAVASTTGMVLLPDTFRLLVQVEEVVDVSQPAERRALREQAGPGGGSPAATASACLKILFSDGHAAAAAEPGVALALGPLAELSPSCRPGIKVLLTGPLTVRRGLCLWQGPADTTPSMIMPPNAWVVGGQVPAGDHTWTRPATADVVGDTPLRDLVGSGPDQPDEPEEAQGEQESRDVTALPPVTGVVARLRERREPASSHSPPRPIRPMMMMMTSTTTTSSSSSPPRPLLAPAVTTTATGPGVGPAATIHPPTLSTPAGSSWSRPPPPPPPPQKVSGGSDHGTSARITWPPTGGLPSSSSSSSSSHGHNNNNPYASKTHPRPAAASSGPAPHSQRAAAATSTTASSVVRSATMPGGARPLSFGQLRTTLQTALQPNSAAYSTYHGQRWIVSLRQQGVKLHFNIEKRKDRPKGLPHVEKYEYVMNAKFVGPLEPEGCITCRIASEIMEPFFQLAPGEMRQLNKTDRNRAGELVKEGGNKLQVLTKQLQSYEVTLLHSPEDFFQSPGARLVDGDEPVLYLVKLAT